MDKDSIILKYDQEELKDIKKGINELSNDNNYQSKQLNDIQDKIKYAYAMLNKKPLEPNFKMMNNKIEEKIVTSVYNYDDLYEKAKLSLIERGLDIDNLSYSDLLSESELKEIEKELNKPLSKQEKWIKGDFIVVFIAASIGSLADIVLSSRNNKFTGRGSEFSEWLNQFHKHASGDPIDYQGQGFGGGYHRGLSRGHDILRFIEAIMMFKNGEFVGTYYEYGQTIEFVSKVNQYGTAYEQLSTIEAIIRYAQHMVADLFSTCSLPFPGTSFLVECDNRQLRQFAMDMYQNGFNCKNVITQSLSTIIIEIIIRMYYSIRSVKEYKEEFQISENYSNIEAFKCFFKPINKEKLNEMLLVAHSITTAVNIGKIVIKKAPWEINVTEIFSVVKYGVKVLNSTISRYSEYEILIRNADEIHQKWEDIEKEICYNEVIMREIKDVLII